MPLNYGRYADCLSGKQARAAGSKDFGADIEATRKWVKVCDELGFPNDDSRRLGLAVVEGSNNASGLRFISRNMLYEIITGSPEIPPHPRSGDLKTGLSAVISIHTILAWYGYTGKEI